MLDYTYCSGRRIFLGTLGAGMAAGLLGAAGLAGCSKKTEPPLRIASLVFPGYELMFLAAERQYFSPQTIRMLDMPSATACLQALASGSVEGAALTLDEVISARADNMPLKVVAVFDISLGADVVLAKPGIRSLSDLKGKRIGVEQSAAGAVMLDALLNQAGLSSHDVQLVYATFDRHYDLYMQNEVDALVTFQPLPQQLESLGAIHLFDSSQIPGRIVDVLAVRPDVVETSPQSLRQLVSGHFRALAELRNNPAAASQIISHRLGVPPAEVPAAYTGLDLLDVAANQNWLNGHPNKLETAAASLQQIMLKADLLQHEVDLKDIADGSFLPAGMSA